MEINDEAWKSLGEAQELFFDEPPDYEGAADLFERVRASYSDWAEVHGWLGSTYAMLGDEERAAAAWQDAHRLDPRDARPLISFGVLLARQRHFEEAISLLEQGVALKPHYGFADARLFLAEAYEGSGQLEKAKEQWREVLNLEPMYPSDDAPMKEAQQKLSEYGELE